MVRQGPPEQSRRTHHEPLNLKLSCLRMKVVFSKKHIVNPKFQYNMEKISFEDQG